MTESISAVATVASNSSPELELPPVSPNAPLEDRVYTMEKNIAWIKEALHHMLRIQVYGESRENTPAFLTSPIPATQQFQTLGTPTETSNQENRDRLLSMARPTVPQQTAKGFTPHPTPPPPPRVKTSLRRLDLPSFECKNPDDWIFRVEIFFGLNRIAQGEYLDHVLTCLTGEVVAWWKYDER